MNTGIMTSQMEWMMITADPHTAKYAEESGVQKIFIDMESHGKASRQGHLDTHKAHHTFSDISYVREVLTTAELMVRLNPMYSGTINEVTEAIARGANRLMLPMFSTVDEVRSFRKMVPDDTPITYLAETPAALARVEAWCVELRSGDEVHFGLNDLSIGMGLHFLFEPLAGGLLDTAARRLRESSIAFGIGGVARSGEGELPAEWTLGEHVRLGSTRAILSRAFHGMADNVVELRSSLDLKEELEKLAVNVREWQTASSVSLEHNRARVANTSFNIASAKWGM